MAKKKEVRNPVCGKCMEPIPLGEITNAFYAGYEYRHGCGRVIVKGSGISEVPIANHDDLSSINPSTSEPTGDA